jgi:hypothetical protein
MLFPFLGNNGFSVVRYIKALLEKCTSLKLKLNGKMLHKKRGKHYCSGFP